MFLRSMAALRMRNRLVVLPRCAVVCVWGLILWGGLGLLLPNTASAIGLMVPQDGSQVLKLVHHHVQVRVQERGATTRVEQIFSNPNAHPIEAIYFFPLPVDATVDEFALWMNGSRQVGKVLSKSEARRVYESIVRATRDPGLIEYVDAQLFQARVFPIPPRGEQKVELTYTHLVPYEAGIHRYVYPMRTDQKATETLREFLFSIEVEGKMPIQNLYSPTHRISQKVSGNRASASFEKTHFRLDDDFRLYWRVDDQEVGVTLLTHQEGDDAGYFLLMASPQDGYRQKEEVGKRLSFVIDTSGSMAGEKMKALKSALVYGIAHLGEDDLFQIVTFGGHVERLEKRMISANERNKRAALDFIKMLDAVGGTPIDEALQLALTSATGSRKIPHHIVFLTDGRPTIGETDPQKIRARVAAKADDNVRIFALGIGEDVNPTLLDDLADENHGRSVYLRGDASVENDLRAFFDRIRHPVLFDVSWDIQPEIFDGRHPMRFFQSLPTKIGDLFFGEQVLVLGRFSGEGNAKLTLRANTPRGDRNFRYPVVIRRGDRGHGFLPRLWAQAEVARMMREIRAHGENPDLVAELRQMAIRFGIVTPYTSYLVVEQGMEDFVAQDRPPIFRPPTPLPRPRPTKRAVEHFADSDVPSSQETVAEAKAMREVEAWHARAGRASLEAESGADAVRMAKELKHLQEGVLSTTSSQQRTEIYVDGVKFLRQADMLIDTRCAGDDIILRVQMYSEAYFQLLQLRPKLRAVLKLSEQMRIQLQPGRTLWIDSAPSQVTESELRTFLGGD